MIELLRADITTLSLDAIVNAANSALRGGGGVDGAIHRAAGPALLEELQQWSHCPPGSAVLTGGHDLPARYVIHAVGPVWRGGDRDEAKVLRAAYEAVFALASEQQDIRTIAFPAISTGVYNYPKREAARIAVAAMRAHEEELARIVVCVFDEDNRAAYREALGDGATAAG
jgi:O-acetyl-ADP-ribose deacetylase (regulator of RNase III)